MPYKLLNSKMQGVQVVPEFIAIAKCFVVHCTMIKTHPVTHFRTYVMMEKEDCYKVVTVAITALRNSNICHYQQSYDTTHAAHLFLCNAHVSFLTCACSACSSISSNSSQSSSSGSAPEIRAARAMKYGGSSPIAVPAPCAINIYNK